MSSPDTDTTHLVSLIAAAEAEAARLGARGASVAAALKEAGTEARSLGQAAGSAAEEGIRVNNLTTDNDK